MKLCESCNKPLIQRQHEALSTFKKRRFCDNSCSKRSPLTMPERFWSYVDKRDVGCWEWTGGKDFGGYGLMKIGGRSGKRVLAHRLSHLITHGYIPKGVVMHTCDNPGCVNPDHLRSGTALDNARDMIAKGRAAWQKRAMAVN